MSNKCLICEKNIFEHQLPDRKFICKQCISEVIVEAVQIEIITQERAINIDKIIDFEFCKK